MTEPTQPVTEDPKYRVTMRSLSLTSDGAEIERKRLDFVPQSLLAAFVADARTRWQAVVVSDEPDYGPGGEDGDTHVPQHLVGGAS